MHHVLFFGRTHRAFGSNGDRLQQDLHDAGSDPRRVLVVGVQVVQDLLDDVVGVLSL